MATISATGLIVPSTFDMWVSATMRVRGPSRASQRRQIEPAVVGDRGEPQDHALALAQEVPGHDVGVVLHLGEHDLVAGR